MSKNRLNIVRSPDSGLTLLEIVVSVALLGTMFIWILQAVMGGYNQERQSSGNTAGAVAAAAIMDRLIDCINADPRFFSFERLTALEIVANPDHPSQYEHKALFVAQNIPAGMPKGWENLRQSKLFYAFDLTDPVISSGTSDLAFSLTITDEFPSEFTDRTVASLCKKARIEVFRLQDLRAERFKSIFRITRTCFLAPNLSLDTEQIRQINMQASADDTEKAIAETLKAIEPTLAELNDFAEAKEFASALVLIAAEMNRLVYECRGRPLPGVASPTLPAGEPKYNGYESRIAVLTAKKRPDASTTIQLATLHRRTATRILEAHKRCLGPSRKIQKMVEELRKDLKDYVEGTFMPAAVRLQKACEAVKVQTRNLREDSPDFNVASTAFALKELRESAQKWDATLNEGKNLRLLQLASLYSNFFPSMSSAMYELEALPARYFKHLHLARDHYFALLTKYVDDEEITPLALTNFANQALETHFALALVGTGTANLDVLRKTTESGHRLQKETPLLFREYWNDQIDLALNEASPEQRDDFYDRNASYTLSIIPTLIGLHKPEPASFSVKFSPSITPQRVLWAAREELDANRFPPGYWLRNVYIATDKEWTLGGFINKVDELYCRITPIVNDLDRVLTGVDRDDVITACNSFTESPGLADILDRDKYEHPCATLYDIRQKLKEGK